MTCPKCHKELRSSDERWYDGSCLEHGRPTPIEGNWYYVKLEDEPTWTLARWKRHQIDGDMGWVDDRGWFGNYMAHWLPIPTVQELLLTTKGQI